MLSAPPISKRSLAAILLLGAALRLYPIWFGLPFFYARPDESETIGHAVGVLDGDLNPHFFHWPSLTFYLLAAILAVVKWIRNVFFGDAELAREIAVLTARAVVAVAGTLTVLPVYRLTRRAFGETTGLMAAFFLAVAVLHVRDSHFAMTDVLMTLFLSLCLARLVSAFDGVLTGAIPVPAALRGFAVAGLLGGLATSTKYNAAAVIAAMGAAQLIMLARLRRAPWSVLAWAPAVVFTLAGVAGFLAGTPYSVLDAPTFSEHFRYDLEHLSEPHGVDVGPGWYAHLTRSLPYGAGPPMFAAAVAGLVLAIRAAPPHAAVLIAFTAAFLAALAGSRTVFFRYVMPLIPMVCIFAAVAAVTLANAIARLSVARPRLAIAASALAIGGWSLVSSVWMDLLLAKTDTRVVAARWLAGQLRPEHSLHDAGGNYVRLDLHASNYHQWNFDARTQSFGDPDGRTPYWIVLHESPLRLYAQPDPGLQALVRDRYARVFVARGTRSPDSPGVYDAQDAFFMPFSRFWEVERPGPTVSVYRRRE